MAFRPKKFPKRIKPNLSSVLDEDAEYDEHTTRYRDGLPYKLFKWDTKLRLEFITKYWWSGYFGIAFWNIIVLYFMFEVLTGKYDFLWSGGLASGSTGLEGSTSIIRGTGAVLLFGVLCFGNSTLSLRMRHHRDLARTYRRQVNDQRVQRTRRGAVVIKSKHKH